MSAPVIALAAPGPGSSDTELSAWRDAVSSGRRPAPTKERWQVLRAGVVNLWEFDTAEYWFADGRAQFVGQNQSGKSTLMALTTLIMLAGDLDRQYVDTFGERHKTFRYYVEPSEDPTDRRETQNNLNRGWAWVEYGRLTATGEPEFFTTLLYAQARRGARDYVKHWATCAGTARVGDELQLATAAHTAQPGDLTDVRGFKVASSGTEYKQRLSNGLFGFDDSDRLDSVVKMLKVLRTPHLGRKLDPVFFTEQMREALPAISKGEIDELAEGWDQLDKLANDRDSAEAARAAVVAFLRKAWNPWADSVLRRHADELVAANTRFDQVTRGVREAQESLDRATRAQSTLESSLRADKDTLARDDAHYEDLLESRAYVEAHEATTRVATLRADADRLQRGQQQLESDANKAGAQAERRAKVLQEEQSKLERAEQSLTRARTAVTADATAARLPAAAAQWTAELDLGRLSQAVTERKGHVNTARALLRAFELRTGEENTADQLLQTASTEHTRRTTALSDATALRERVLQTLSDELERWAVRVGDAAPSSDVRSGWVDQVVEQSQAATPRAVLGSLVRTAWLAPLAGGLRERAARQEHEAADLTAQARARGTAIQQLLDEPEPHPAPPTRWTRRARPTSGPDGSPLWLLLDPHDDVEPAVLDHLEAALDATGLLDAWVSPDGVYVPDRDGHDAAVHLFDLTGADTGGSDTDASNTAAGGARQDLTSVLRPAASAGPRTGPLTRLLRHVTYLPAEKPLPELADGTTVTADGRWSTALTRGAAAPGPHGAELLGTAARTAARERRIAALREEQEQLTARAGTLTQQARVMRTRAAERDRQAGDAPDDDAAVRAATAVLAAATELEQAQQRLERRTSQLQAAQTATAQANAALLEHTGAHDLPSGEPGLANTAAALDAAASSVAGLRLAAREVEGGRRHVEREQTTVSETAAHAQDLRGRADDLRRAADKARDAADSAEEALGQSEKDILEAVATLRHSRQQLRIKIDELDNQCRAQAGKVAQAQEKLERAGTDREQTETDRAAALLAWWRPVDAGLAAARGLPAAPETDRRLTYALTQARAARESLRITGWPEAPEATADKEGKVNAAYAKLTGNALVELRTVLESSGGRSAMVADAEDGGQLPAIHVLVDSSGTSVEPTEAVVRLTAQATQLAQLHDEKMQQVLVELLSSTFVEHLRERLGSVVKLLNHVNRILAAHPTGANGTTLRLRRQPADRQQAAFEVLISLEDGFVDSEEVQAQVRTFLEQQIREAQELGRSNDVEWKEHLAGLLDYRKWFDVLTEYKVASARAFKPLTAEVHARDSGGGKVVTLLQPLLATLVALYDESATAPRPLWLDEAFTGVDDGNRSTMLDLLVEFDLDFLLAGPTALVASAQVPSAAAWFVTRAPAPVAGVDLSLMLWAGKTMTLVPMPAAGLGSARQVVTAQDTDALRLFDDEGT